MAEYIERDQILGYLDLVVIHARGVAGNDSILKKVTGIVENMRDLVAEAPAADVQTVVHGRWINKTNHNRAVVEQRVDCSACGHIFWHTSAMSYNYCPNCGARMDG